MAEITLLDELLSIGVDEEAASMVLELVNNAETYTVASTEDMIVIRGRLRGNPPNVEFTRVGTNLVYCGGGVIVILWRESVSYVFAVVAGGTGGRVACCNTDA